VIYTIVFHLRKSWFEGVFKEALYSLYFCILWHDVFTVILNAIPLWKRVTAATPCDIYFDRWLCILRLIITVAYPAFPCIHATITVQRIVSTYSGNKMMHHLIAQACLVFTVRKTNVYIS
ncbi:hypothetical protein PMAYCL1PPCAC_10321, partial [Pristionchus mayeri]